MTEKIIAISLDSETTGLIRPQPLSIAWHGLGALPSLKILSSFESLFDVTEPITFEAQKIHGISKKMLAGKPVWSSMEQLKIPATTEYMICYNAAFDWEKVLKKPAGFKVICLMKLAKKYIPKEEGCTMSPSGKFRSYKLVDVCGDIFPEKRDFIKSEAHNASVDAKLTILLLGYFIKVFEIQSWEELFKLYEETK